MPTIPAEADGLIEKKPSGAMGKTTLTSPRGYLPPTTLSASRMLCARTPTLKRVVPLLTSTEILTILCCSITYSSFRTCR
jgi:hypothetical protein